MSLRLRELYTPLDPGFEAAYALYEASFPEDERESRDSIEAWLQPTRISSPEQEQIKRFFVLERDALVIGMTVHEFHPVCGLGWLIYIVVQGAERGLGLGVRLLESIYASCRLDAQFTGSAYRGVILEVERVEDAQTEDDRAFRTNRLAYFDRRGAQLLTREYVQPALGAHLAPVPLNLLIADARPNLDNLEKAAIIIDYYTVMWGFELDSPELAKALAPVQNG